MHAAFVRERAFADVGFARRQMYVCDFRDQSCRGREHVQLFLRYASLMIFQLQISNNRTEICISAAFAVADIRALYLCRACLYPENRVGDGKPRVVVTMDADRHCENIMYLFDRIENKIRICPAVCIAQTEAVRAAVSGCFQRLKGIIGIGLVSVEEMLRVINDLFAFVFEKPHGFFDHFEIFFQGGAENFSHMQIPGFAENRNDGRIRAQQRAHIGIVFHFNIPTSCAAECA